jgi:hypothetical protein
MVGNYGRSLYYFLKDGRGLLEIEVRPAFRKALTSPWDSLAIYCLIIT